MKLKTIFMGNSDKSIDILNVLKNLSNLSKIVTSKDKKKGRGQKYEISKIKNWAKLYKIDIIEVDYLSNKIKLEKELSKLEPDFLIVYAYGFILSENILKIPKIAAINLHTSLLPKYRGASPIHAAIINNDKITGVTAQIMIKKLDAGDIIHQIKTPINKKDDYNTLNDRLSYLSSICIYNVLKLYEKNKIVKKIQNNSKIIYCNKIKKEDGHINWNNSYEEIFQKMKAYINWPKSYTYYKNTRIIIHKLIFINNTLNYKVGQIVCFDKNAILVQCGNGILNLIELQINNKKRMNFKNFVNGYKWQINTFLK